LQLTDLTSRLLALDIFRAPRAPGSFPVTEMLHLMTFRSLRPHAPQLSQFFCTKQSRTGRWHKLVRMGGAMRESLGSEIPDTAAYTEWLALVGSMVVAVLVCAVLFSNGVLT
jgi:hypothetical protein